jgi:hypothetical protein
MQASLSTWMRGAAAGLGIVCVIGMAPGSARAGTVSETVSVASTPTNWSNTLNFQGFTALAGAGKILQSVTFDLTETLTGSAFATNNSTTSSATGDFVITNTAEINAGTFGKVINQQASSSITIPINSTSPTQNISGSTSASTTLTSNLSQFLSGYTGSASDNAVEGLSFNGGNLSATFTDSGALSVLVTYAYSVAPVPEPATIAILGVGLLGLGLVRPRRA